MYYLFFRGYYKLVNSSVICLADSVKQWHMNVFNRLYVMYSKLLSWTKYKHKSLDTVNNYVLFLNSHCETQPRDEAVRRARMKRKLIRSSAVKKYSLFPGLSGTSTSALQSGFNTQQTRGALLCPEPSLLVKDNHYNGSSEGPHDLAPINSPL